jgi:ABC-type lipoprotein release transport system permease subunit
MTRNTSLPQKFSNLDQSEMLSRLKDKQNSLRASSQSVLETHVKTPSNFKRKQTELIPKKVLEVNHMCTSHLIEDKMKEFVGGFP